ncbi:MAG: efflux RND transporter periplasmic adaptor subunit [Burkholderiaceae bacterium]
MKPTTWKGWLALIVLVLGATALLAWALWPRALAVDVGTVSEGVFERTLARDGKTRLSQRHVITAPVAGRLQRITLREGDAVQRGQVLARIAPQAVALLDARGSDEQRERVAALAAQLARAQVLVAQTEAATAQAQADLSRTEALAAQGFVSPLQAESQRLALRLRSAERDAALQDVTAARHQLALAQVALRPAAAGANMLAGSGAWLDVRAPVAGRVIRLHKDSEGEVAQGAALLEVGDLTQREAVVDLLTEEAEQVRPGAAAWMSAQTGALPAVVARIEPGGFTKVSALGVEEQRVHVVLQLRADADAAQREAWMRLGDAWRVDARIVVQREGRARQVPASAVFPSGAGMAVFVIDAGRARLTPVTVRARHEQQARVDDRLPVGTRVVMYPPSALQHGQRVRERDAPTP